MTFKSLLATIRRNGLIIGITVVVCALVGLGVALITPPSYTTETQVLFTPSLAPDATKTTSENAAARAQAITVIAGQLPTYAALTTTASVLDPAAKSVGGGATSIDLKDDVTATVVPDTSIVTIATTARSAEGTAKLANAVATSLIAQVGGLDTSSGATSVTGTVVEAPVVPNYQTSPSIILDVLLGLLAGLVLAYLIVIAREALLAPDRTAAA